MDARDERRVQELEQEIAELKNEFHSYMKEKELEERKKIRMALLWAGAIIIGLSSFIWTEILWPILKAGASK